LPRELIFIGTDPSILSPNIFDKHYVEFIMYDSPEDLLTPKEPLSFGVYRNLRKVEFRYEHDSDMLVSALESIGRRDLDILAVRLLI